MNLEFAIVHDLRKQVGQQPSLNLRGELLGHSESLLNLSNNLNVLYKRKMTKGLGSFHEDIETYRFSSHLTEFLQNSNEESFKNLTIRSMNIMKDRISSENLATGGYVLFLSYQENNDRFLFITMLRQTIGCVITDDLNIDEAKHLEMDKLHIGCQIDISKWTSQTENQYITFIKGRSTQTTPQYFLKAIGCDEFANSAFQTNELIRAINDFVGENNYTHEQKQNLKQIVFDYCSERENILLDSLSEFISDEEPEKFLEFVNQGGYKLGNGFEPHKMNLKKLKEIKATGEGIKLSFPYSMLGTRIQLDEENNRVTINNPPESLARTLRDEL